MNVRSVHQLIVVVIMGFFLLFVLFLYVVVKSAERKERRERERFFTLLLNRSAEEVQTELQQQRVINFDGQANPLFNLAPLRGLSPDLIAYVIGFCFHRWSGKTRESLMAATIDFLGTDLKRLRYCAEMAGTRHHEVDEIQDAITLALQKLADLKMEQKFLWLREKFRPKPVTKNDS